MKLIFCLGGAIGLLSPLVIAAPSKARKPRTITPHYYLSPQQAALKAQMEALKAPLKMVKAQRNQMLRLYKPNSPEVRALDEQINQLQNQLQKLLRQQKETPPDSIPPQGADSLSRQLSFLLKQRQELLFKYTPNSPEVRALDQQIARLRNQLRNQQNPNPRRLPPATKPHFQLLGH